MPVPEDKDYRRHVDARLQKAARELDADAVQAALADGANPDSKDGRGWTPLKLASMGGGVDAMRVLLAAGAKLNGGIWDEWSPVSIAARYGQADALRLLAQAGADIDWRNADGYSAAALACLAPPTGSDIPDTRPSCLRLLISLGADLSTRPDDLAPLACICAMEDAPDCLALLAASDCPLDEPNRMGRTPIQIAAMQPRKQSHEILTAALEAREIGLSAASGAAAKPAPRI